MNEHLQLFLLLLASGVTNMITGILVTLLMNRVLREKRRKLGIPAGKLITMSTILVWPLLGMFVGAIVYRSLS